MRGLIVGLALAGLGCEPQEQGFVSSALHDGGVCDHPDRLLYELAFTPSEDSLCGPLRTRVRRLTGTSKTGQCRMDVSTSINCGVLFQEECVIDALGVSVSGEIRQSLADGTADVTFTNLVTGEELCSGGYAVSVDVVR